MKINTKKIAVDLKGKELTNEDGVVRFGDAIANMLLAYRAGGKMKMFILAQKFSTEDVIELDMADFSMVKSAIETSEIYPSMLVPAQVLVYLESLKEDPTNT